ncbi:precorrin-3B C(17)-methyltransferase [Thermomonospora umbrina]|uniref:Cobalt-precorrin 5A hydrolase/precorrin-3B C17-methyltransferase n=1 Tax=Thermomonospora umbrina TaxID=111806 RepID=A0A3D9SP36_9ACTN|nr:precorrin-3B C(17)-methyltransferase [Thermomonospora umbrina]REE95723.1 cobalt-precorrin 5A hydrolase/precorrin-3B C17-methyltransferase [Thermomonospora umbrina]
MIGVVAATAAGRASAAALAEAWPDEVRLFTENGPADGLRAAWEGCDTIVAFLAVGAAVRVLAPLLGHKTEDPAVVCVDESLRYAVPVLGGHHGGNTLAHRLSGTLGCEPVITTASDRAGLTALDSYGADLGFSVDNPDMLARTGTAVLSREPVRLTGATGWPLPPLPPNVGPDADAALTIHITDLLTPPPPAVGELVYRPPSLVVGVGSARGVSAEEVGGLIDAALREAGLSPASVRCVATVDLKADEEGILAAARERGWDVVTHPASVLAAVDVPNPSETVRAEVGTPSVAEAAALHTARSHGKAAALVVEKRKTANTTVAVARLVPKGRLAIIGLGPGARDLLTPRAVTALQRASVVVGLDQYVDQIRDLLRPGTRVVESGLGQEEARARAAVQEAQAGHAVALIGSGDAGIYAMASPALEFAGDDIEVEGVPGITAAIAASNLLGAPLGHDHAYVSLSDLHTPWEAIERRVRAAAEGDFTVCFYNPRSRARDWQLPKALAILAAHRPAETPVGFVRNAGRPDEALTITTLGEMDPAAVDMFTVVLVGSGRSRRVAGRFVTPRGYRWA